MQYSITQFMSWVTSTIAFASWTSSPTRCLDFSRKAASPVERTSSSSRMSGSTDVAMANPRRARMPDEYVLIGASMNSPRSAYATIPGSFSSTSLWSMPMKAPARRMLSVPVSSWSKPTPRVSRLEMRPSTSTSPSDGVRIPARTCSSVLLPAPLGPMTPSESPWCTARDTLRSAQKSVSLLRRTRRTTDAWTVCFRVRCRLYLTPRSWVRMGGLAPGGGRHAQRTFANVGSTRLNSTTARASRTTETADTAPRPTQSGARP